MSAVCSDDRTSSVHAGVPNRTTPVGVWWSRISHAPVISMSRAFGSARIDACHRACQPAHTAGSPMTRPSVTASKCTTPQPNWASPPTEMPSSRAWSNPARPNFERGGVAEGVDAQRVRIGVPAARPDPGEVARRQRPGRGDGDDQERGHHREHGVVHERRPAAHVIASAARSGPGESTEPQGSFDQPVRDLGEHDRDGQAQREQPDAVKPGSRGDEHAYRPMPEVQRVGTQTDRDERGRA